MRYLILFIVLGILSSCKKEMTEQEIIDRAIESHGGNLFEQKIVKFDFRGKTYSLYQENGVNVYTRTFTDDSLGQVVDTLINSQGLTRYTNGDLVNLSDKDRIKHANAINSVLYFFQLPYGLNDPAVKKKLLSKNIVNGHMYHKVEVTFKEEGGGDDHEDVFVYWINDKTYTMDYLAYAYHVNGGGQRFRAAVNRKNMDGLTIQDYINYKPKDSTVLVHNLDVLFETKRIEKVSKIENKNLYVANL